MCHSSGFIVLIKTVSTGCVKHISELIQRLKIRHVVHSWQRDETKLLKQGDRLQELYLFEGTFIFATKYML